jgi:hypothetical protein
VINSHRIEIMLTEAIYRSDDKTVAEVLLKPDAKKFLDLKDYTQNVSFLGGV